MTVEQHTYPKRSKVNVCTLCNGIIRGMLGDCWCDVDEDDDYNDDKDKPSHSKQMIRVISLEEQ